MNCALSSTTYDPAGHVPLPLRADVTPGDTGRRLTRISTLDGGAVLNDAGFSEADRTLQLRWPADDATREAAVDRMVRLYSTAVVSLRAGVYLAALESYTPGAEESTLRALVLEKLSA